MFSDPVTCPDAQVCLCRVQTCHESLVARTQGAPGKHNHFDSLGLDRSKRFTVSVAVACPESLERSKRSFPPDVTRAKANPPTSAHAIPTTAIMPLASSSEPPAGAEAMW